MKEKRKRIAEPLQKKKKPAKQKTHIFGFFENNTGFVCRFLFRDTFYFFSHPPSFGPSFGAPQKGSLFFFLVPFCGFVGCMCRIVKMKSILFCLVLVRFVFGCFAVPPKLVDQKLWFVNDTILNVEYEMAVFQMEFDQDLYLSGESFLCGEAEKDCPTSDCIPCDWSSQQVLSLLFFLFDNWIGWIKKFYFVFYFVFSSLSKKKNSQQDVIILGVVVRLKLEEMLLIKWMSGANLPHLTSL